MKKIIQIAGGYNDLVCLTEDGKVYISESLAKERADKKTTYYTDWVEIKLNK